MGIGVSDTLFHVEHTLPRLPSFGQFCNSIPALWKRPNGFSCGQMCGYFEGFGEIRDSTGGDYFVFPLSAFRLPEEHGRIEVQRFAQLVEKVGPQPARFDQSDGPLDKARDDYARQTSARTDIGPRGPRSRLEPRQLRRIDDMAIPETVKRRSSYEVVPSTLLPKERDICPNLLNCFT